MRFVEDFRAAHIKKYPNNEEIYIVGCGCSLDDFPDDFFYEKKNGAIVTKKITIALNWAIIAFPECTYWHAGHPERVLWMKENNPEVLKRSFLLHPMVPFIKEFPKRITEGRSLELLDEYKDDPVYLRWHWILGNRSQFMKLLPQTIDAIIAGRSCRYICLSTIAHYAIQIAIVLGAKEITMVGCEAKTTNNRIYAQSRGLSNFYPKKPLHGESCSTKKFGRTCLGTKILAKAFKPYGIEVRRYYYDKGYENII